MIAEHDADPEAHQKALLRLGEKIAQMDETHTAWQLRQDADITLIKDSLITDMESKLFYVFDNISGVNLIRGVYNQAHKRLEC